MKIRELFEENIPTYRGDIEVPENWRDLSKLPEKYPGYTPGCKLIGNFSCSGCTSLTSLEGSPSSVTGFFSCAGCTSLTSLEGSPNTVDGDFRGHSCKSITSLKGAPSSVGGIFSCGHNSSLISLEGAPNSVGSHFSCYGCTSLTSLKGAPNSVGDDFSCNMCPSLRKSILSVLRIKNVKRISIDNEQVQDIINKHLARDRDMLDCQEDLIDAGLQEYARL